MFLIPYPFMPPSAKSNRIFLNSLFITPFRTLFSQSHKYHLKILMDFCKPRARHPAIHVSAPRSTVLDPHLLR